MKKILGVLVIWAALAMAAPKANAYSLNCTMWYPEVGTIAGVTPIFGLYRYCYGVSFSGWERQDVWFN